MGQQLSNRGIGQVLMAIMLLSSSLLASTQSAWADAPICSPDGGIPDASITSYISGEVRRNAIATRALVDTLDDSWRTAVGQPADPELESWFGTATNTQGSVNTFDYVDPITNRSIAATIELVQIPIGESTCSGETTTTGSSPTLSNSRSLQSSAPRPASLYDSTDQPLFWNDARGGASNDNQRNAVMVSFAQPIQSFGVWVGDMETRTDGNGTPAILRLLDISGNRIGEDIKLEPTTLYDGNAPDPAIVDQSLCGGTANNEPGCGNHSTRWVGFVDDSGIPRVQQLMLIVGDDDSAVGNNNGDSEHISFIGANRILPDSSPQVHLVKRITAINGNRTVNQNDNTPLNIDVNDNVADSADDHSHWPTDYLIGAIDAGLVKPGDTIEYTVYFLNTGGSDAANVRICDWIQPHQSFVTEFYGASSPGDGYDIEMSIGGSLYQLTAASDMTDRAELTTVDRLPTRPECNLSTEATANDSVLVLDITGTTGNPTGLSTLPGTTEQGTPENAFGFFRFTTQVTQ